MTGSTDMGQHAIDPTGDRRPLSACAARPNTDTRPAGHVLARKPSVPRTGVTGSGPSSETRRADETFELSRRFDQVALGQERPEESKGRLANQIVGICLVGVGLAGAAVALILGRPDVATDGIVPIVLGFALLAGGHLIARRRRS